MRIGLHLFGMMFIQYAVITVNTVAIANGNYLGLFITDLAITLLGFTILKKVEAASGPFQMACYALGGALGAQVALLASLHFLKG